MSSDLLQSALKRATQQASPQRGRTTQSPPFLSDLSLASDPSTVFGEDDENDLIAVMTPFASPSPSTNSSRSSSRATSPSRKGKGGGKPRRDKTKENAKILLAGTSKDPLIRFDNKINVRIFAELDSGELVICSEVCKKWRNSQTINFTWFNLLQSLTYVEIPVIISTSEAELLWTRRDSKINWRERFASIYAVPEIVEGADELNEEGLTMKEEREEKWQQENDELEAIGNDKVAMREHYKNLGNSKVKGKSMKGGESTWTVDLNIE